MFGDFKVDESLPRRERERQMRRNAMLEAACAVFAEKGYTHATIDEIAQRSEFGKGTLYNYFEGGKEDIFFAIFDEIYDDFCSFIRSSFTNEELGSRPIRELFREFIASCFEFFLERKSLFMMLIKEAHRMMFSDEPKKATFFINHRERVVSALTEPIEHAIARGEIKPFPPRSIANMILGNINGCQMQMMLEREQGGAKSENEASESADFLTTMLFDGLLTQKVPQTVS